VTSTPLAYVELDVRSNFSFLEGGSHAEELVIEAARLGLSAIGVADRNTLAGVVRVHKYAKEHGLRFLVGCRLAFLDGSELIVYPRDRAAYGRLCRLLSIGKSGVEAASVDAEDRIPKAETRLTFEQAAALGEGMVALVPAPARLDAAFEARLAAWRRAWPDRLYLAAAPAYAGDDRARLNRLAQTAERAGAPLAATNAVLYHQPERRPLQDVLTCIREGVTIDKAGYRLQANAERHLKGPAEMARLFRGHEAALARSQEIVEACRFSLDELSYEYPHEPVPPGWTPQRWLIHLSFAGLKWRFPNGPPKKVLDTVRKELRLISTARYAAYFLTVHDVVKWARDPERGILCQGRGSAANSVVCYCLGITSVDPTTQDLLFERFISSERAEPPDIDVDFEHERREEVMQYMYRRYGRHRAAICATVIHYRPRSAIREVGKALGLTEDVTAQLAGTVWGHYGEAVEDEHVDNTALRREDPHLSRALDLARELVGFPRHLSQHVGGFVLTEGPLVETVPVGNAAMKDRTFIEWDKNAIDELKIMKVDVLALGMLTAIRKAFDMIEKHYGDRLDLAGLPQEKAVYDMLCEADSLGVFQVESRAQMSMLPRLRPREFYDLVVQVAIVRPGPIQGNMVHPYLRGRAEKRAAEMEGREFSIDFPSPSPGIGKPDELKEVLGKTLGVPLFQEQAMRIAMVAAEFTGEEANGLRRAMATFRHLGEIHIFEKRMVGRMIERGYDPEFAANCFSQIKGFGDYGFPESHAAAFAHLVYVSAWIKCFHPEVFAAALLNSQPMGFYAPAQIVRDARAHHIEVRPPDVGASDWDCTLEAPEPEPFPLNGGRAGLGVFEPRLTRQALKGAEPDHAQSSGVGETPPPNPPPSRGRAKALRLGLRQIDGFREAWAQAISAARASGGPFSSLDDLRMRAGLPAAALEALADADALGSLALPRRPALWAAKGLPRAAPAPLFAAAGLEEADAPPPAALPPAPLSEEVVHDYETLRLSLKAHPVSFLRSRLAKAGVRRAVDMKDVREGVRTAAAGVVLVRQRPGSANGVVFLTLEDETGVVNVVVWPSIFERYRPLVMGARLLLVRGRIQRAEDSDGRVTHLVAETIEDRTADLSLLTASGLQDGTPQEVRRHPRNVRVLPKSRDFH
jgi:error-prone DNA polymerase